MKFTMSAVSTVAFTLFTAHAQATALGEDYTLTPKISLLSDYRNQGISQTQNNPTLQADISVLHNVTGLFAGIWGSNVDYASKTRMEQGVYAGIAREITSDINIQTLIGHYIYPKNSSYSTDEYTGIVNAYGFTYTFIYDFNMEIAPNAKYQYIGYTFDTPYDSKLLLEYGWHDLNYDMYANNGSTRQRYHTSRAMLSKPFAGMDWSVSYIDTDMSKSECLTTQGVDDTCSATVVFGVSKTF